MRLLSIETSCDDTAISIMEVKGGVTNASFKVLANNSNSQINIHIPYGGVYPALAKREHAKNLPIVLEASLAQAKLNKKNIKKSSFAKASKDRPVDAIAVTYGPGLEMCLWEGITFAQELAKKWQVPLIPVNHMEGHVLSVFGKNKGKFNITKIKFPALSLLVSGGHTQLVLMKSWLKYEIIGNTLDDAVGEAFDKVARMLDLPYPGGPQISKLAEEERAKGKQSLKEKGGSIFSGSLSAPAGAALPLDPSICETPTKNYFSFSLPRPMMKSKDFNFSFSGLKTAVFYLLKKIEPITEKKKKAVALEFENAAIEPLIYKTQKAVEKYKIKTLIIAGGVACNTHLQRMMKKALGKKVKTLFPSTGLSGDNALMIGIAGYLHYIKDKKKAPKPNTIKATGTLKLK